MIRIPQAVLDETINYKHQVAGRLDGTIAPEVFKPYQGLMGIYEQRQDGQYMVRGVIPSGTLTLEQLLFIKELSKIYANGRLHFTTRQDIQFHGVTLENTIHILEKLTQIGITTKGAGGSGVRNVALSPLSGVSRDEIFDPTEFAHAVLEHFLKDASAYKLPRKYKIAFSNSAQDTAGASLSDMGFVAAEEGGKAGFKVYGAGGLGGSAAPAILLADFIETKDVLYHVEAMKRLFEREGDRNNRNKARIRYILKRLGELPFRKRYEDILAEVRMESGLDLDLEPVINYDRARSMSSVVDARIYKQRDGDHSIYVHPQGGHIEVQAIEPLLNGLGSLESHVSIRLTTTQGFFIRGVQKHELKKVMDWVDAYTSPYEINHTITCTGASTCRLGILDTSLVLNDILKRFEGESVEMRRALPKLFISGCPNSCGQHQKGKIGLTGKYKNTDQGKVAHYTLFLGGKMTQKGAVFAEPIRDIPAAELPQFLVELAAAKIEAERRNGRKIPFDVFARNYKSQLL